MATLPDWRKETTWADAVSRLGADHVAWILQQDNPAGLAQTMADDAWVANLGDLYRCYCVIARDLRARVQK